MQWVQPQYSKSKVNRAGKILVAARNSLLRPPEYDDALQIINNWRSSHSYPLQSIKMTLRTRVKRCDSKALVAQRLKRLSSIETKLLLKPAMALTQMQDIGGCRAVLSTVQDVDNLVAVYHASNTKSGKDRHECSDSYDYISIPKADGYRGHHFVYKYRTRSAEHICYTDHRIEVQIRSRLQHAWATAVETVDAFTRQALKTGGGKAEWQRFFALMGSAIAIMEDKPLVPGTPDNQHDLVYKLRSLAATLRIPGVLESWSHIVKETYPQIAGKVDDIFLLVLDTKKNIITVESFRKEASAEASRRYMEEEKRSRDEPTRQAVLVSVESVEALRAAYPNYFADTHVFITAVNEAME